jgi:hypothetical protein
MSVRIVALLACAALAACAAGTPRPAASPAQDEAPKPAAPANGSDNPVEEVPLDVVVTGQTTSGRVILLRAKIVNPHAETVEGVRLQLVFLAPTEEEDQPKVLGIEQKEMGSTLPAGESTMLRWDVESMYAMDGGQFVLAAYPKKLGDKVMPPPDNWKD